MNRRVKKQKYKNTVLVKRQVADIRNQTGSRCSRLILSDVQMSVVVWRHFDVVLNVAGRGF